VRHALQSERASDRLLAIGSLVDLHRIGSRLVRQRVREEIRKLENDDSRRVSITASQALQKLDESATPARNLIQAARNQPPEFDKHPHASAPGAATPPENAQDACDILAPQPARPPSTASTSEPDSVGSAVTPEPASHSGTQPLLTPSDQFEGAHNGGGDQLNRARATEGTNSDCRGAIHATPAKCVEEQRAPAKPSAAAVIRNPIARWSLIAFSSVALLATLSAVLLYSAHQTPNGPPPAATSAEAPPSSVEPARPVTSVAVPSLEKPIDIGSTGGLCRRRA
jgi:hypothetical protein